MIQLPENIQTDLLFKFSNLHFIKKFGDWFRIKFSSEYGFIYCTMHHQFYRDFMVKIVENLEPRYEEANTVLLDECDEINEIFFVEQGEVLIGYELNKEKRFCISKKDYAVIGGFNCIFDYESEYIYLAKSNLHGQAIRQVIIKQILK